MKNPTQEIEHLREVISKNQEKLIGDILQHVEIYEIKEEQYNKMLVALGKYTKETFRMTKAIEAQEIIEKVLITRLK